MWGEEEHRGGADGCMVNVGRELTVHTGVRLVRITSLTYINDSSPPWHFKLRDLDFYHFL